jgi:hypothetical protein
MGRVAHLERSLGLLIVNPRSGTGAPSAAEVEHEAARKGLDVHVLHRREHHRGRRDAFAHLRALWLSAHERSPEPFTIDGQRVPARIVLVANNAYDVQLFDLGARDRLDEGRLHTYVARDWLPRTWDERVAERFTIERAGGLRAAVDGEPLELGSQVEVSIEPRALRVLLPS